MVVVIVVFRDTVFIVFFISNTMVVVIVLFRNTVVVVVRARRLSFRRCYPGTEERSERGVADLFSYRCRYAGADGKSDRVADRVVRTYGLDPACHFRSD